MAPETNTTIPNRYPKTASPYERAEDSNGDYVVDPDGEFLGVQDGYEWVFDRAEEVEAIEKLHGTNMAVHVGEHEHGGLAVDDVAARMGSKAMNRVEPYGPRTNHHYLARAVQNAVSRGYIDQVADEHGTGWFFGEAVGPKFHNDPHDLGEHLFVPFDYARDKLAYKSYGRYDTDFESIRDWFRGGDNGLFSLFATRMHGQPPVESRPIDDVFVEGLIFVHPDFEGRIRPQDLTVDDDTGKITELAKLRRDQFSGFQNDDWPLTKWGH